MDNYRQLDSLYAPLNIQKIGETDVGLPLHAVILSEGGALSVQNAKEQGKLIFFINNGIHPGEPCGIDASMMWVHDLLQRPHVDQILEESVIVLIPVYNVGGALNRSAFSRANQNGPARYGFRGNAKNLDLNRDFIKCDSRNARAFNRLFAKWKPDLFLDTHTSNGSDYQHTMTYIASLRDRMARPQRKLLYDTVIPRLYGEMAEEDWHLTPYVYARGNPRNGIYAFDDSPRYSSGYAALHYALSFISETHMLKPFEQRVESTYDFIDDLLHTGLTFREEIHRARKAAVRADQRKDSFAIRYSLDRKTADSIYFRGYHSEERTSAVGDKSVTQYNHDKPWADSTPYFNSYDAVDSVHIPDAYIIPQAWTAVINRLRWNDVEMYRLGRDTALSVEQYYIQDMETRNTPYEGHYLHTNIETEKVIRSWSFRKGDWIVPVQVDQLRFLLSTCEPPAPDSWMAWNFFDAVLQQKEHFSAYVFDETAAMLLEKYSALREALEQKKASDPDIASDTRAQLEFIYKRSAYYEKTHRLYPIARFMGDLSGLAEE